MIQVLKFIVFSLLFFIQQPLNEVSYLLRLLKALYVVKSLFLTFRYITSIFQVAYFWRSKEGKKNIAQAFQNNDSL